MAPMPARARTKSPTLIIKDMDDGTVIRTSLRAFCRANRGSLDERFPEGNSRTLCQSAQLLKPGQSFELGGGAAPWVRITKARRAR